MSHGVDILIATPGRLLDLVSQGHVRLTAVKHFVFDEADRMLDMGFIRDVRRIVAMLPKTRQSLLFSATMPEDVADLAGELLHRPVRWRSHLRRLLWIRSSSRCTLSSRLINEHS